MIATLLLIPTPFFAPPALGTPVVCAAPAGATQDVEVDVRVLVVRGNVVEIDRGTNAGAEPGDVVVLRPLGQPEVTGSVRSVTSDAATVVLSAAVGGLAPGVPGVLRMPRSRFPDPDAPRIEGMPPPVWRNPDDQWEAGLPLLAEVTGPRPEERPSEWSGRASLGGYWLTDNGALPRDDQVGRLGLTLEGRNPFGQGGRMHVAVELRAENTDYSDPALEDDSSTFPRVDALSYEWGGTRGAPRRYEVGRFLPFAFPELGLLDGVEASHRFDNGARVGGSIGSLAGLDRERSFENAPQIALWALVPFAEDDHAELGFAVQETWYDGQQDRDLFLARARWTDGVAWRADATTWFDLYRSDDVGKTSGVELTEARASVTRTFESGAGARIDLSSVRFPSLRRYQAQDFSPEELRDAETSTASFSAWIPQGSRGTWNGRVGAWTDSEADGGWADLGYDRRLDSDVFDRGTIAAFYSDNRDGEVIGARAGVSGPGLGGRWSCGFDLGLYDRATTTGGTEQLTQGALRAGWSGALGDDWYLYLDGAQRFGDDQDALSLDFTLQRSF